MNIKKYLFNIKFWFDFILHWIFQHNEEMLKEKKDKEEMYLKFSIDVKYFTKQLKEKQDFGKIDIVCNSNINNL